MQNYDGKFKLNGQEYFYRAKDDSGSSKIARVNNEEHHYRMVEIDVYKRQPLRGRLSSILASGRLLWSREPRPVSVS